MSMKNVRNDQPHSAKFIRQRKFLLVLPVLVIPFLTLLLWTTGIVGEVKVETNNENNKLGLNMSLPSAAPAKDSNWNKLKYYEQADKDSAKIKSLLKNDPYRRMELAALENEDITGHENPLYSYDPYPPGKQQKDQNEERVYTKLAALNKELENATQQDAKSADPKMNMPSTATVNNTDVVRLEKMMKTMQQGTGEDPQMNQLNEMLEKIMDIQHPERLQEKIRENSEKNKRQVFAVERKQDNIVSVLEPQKNVSELLGAYAIDSMPPSLQAIIESNRFYSLDETSFQEIQNAIPAVIHESQTLVSGATVKLRLLEDVFIGGVLIPKDHFVFGLATLNGERLMVSIQSIQFLNNILPVALSVYDMDGLSGIYIPGAISRDVAKRSAGQSVQQLGSINNLNPSLGAQMTTAGLQAAQNLITKNVKLIKVNVKAGYRILLKDENQNDQ